MVVIDIDSHLYEPLNWYEQRFPDLAAKIPPLDPLSLLMTASFGDLLGCLPRNMLPTDPLQRIPRTLRDMYRNADAAQRETLVRSAFERLQKLPGAHDAHERTAWLDAQGIDRQLVLPSIAFPPIARMRREHPTMAPQLIAAYHTWVLEILADHTERLIPVGVADFETMDRAAVTAELERLRKAGGRSFVMWPMPARGKSLAHPDFDWIWSLSTDLGMIPMVHGGLGRPAFDEGWFNNGRTYPESVSTYMTQVHQVPEICLTELLFGGVFQRHPKLNFFVCEVGIEWVPEWLERIDSMRDFAARLGGEKWPYPLNPSDYVRRQIRVTPLEHDPTASVIERVGPDIVVFSSDYPHPEGGQEAKARYRGVLEPKFDGHTLDRFFGASAAELLAVGA